MSPSFSDGKRLKARAKKSLDDGLAQIKRWWSERYKLPPNHELFMNQSLAEHTQEMYEDLMFKRDDIRRNLESGGHSSEESQALLEQLNVINKALGDDEEVQDTLFDEWERELEEGRIPDLNAQPGSN